jgi:DNA-binding response OmpR family regulator
MDYKILVVEDEPQIRDIVEKYLKNAGYEVYSVDNGIDGLAEFAERQPHIVILDIMMPGISGFDVLKELRLVSHVPVIVLTAKQKEADRLAGFDLGADDYVMKPFSPKELVKRVQAVLRRVYSAPAEKPMLVSGDFALDIAQEKLYRNGHEIEITHKEFQLLEVFFSNEGVLLSRQQLIDKAFGYDYDGFDRTIDTYIKQLRQKIEKDNRRPVYLKTKYGAGYIFEGKANDH